MLRCSLSNNRLSSSWLSTIYKRERFQELKFTVSRSSNITIGVCEYTDDEMCVVLSIQAKCHPTQPSSYLPRERERRKQVCCVWEEDDDDDDILRLCVSLAVFLFLLSLSFSPGLFVGEKKNLSFSPLPCRKFICLSLPMSMR